MKMGYKALYENELTRARAFESLVDTYKKKCEELVTDHVKMKQENEQLRKDNRWIRRVLAVTLAKVSSVVVREEELEHAPEIVLAENLEDELIISIKRRPGNGRIDF